MAFNISVSGLGWEYYFMYSSMPMYVPSAVNSLATIVMIRDYRREAKSLFGRL
jgi:hypothetical protein